jgi:hypothetical protein
LFSNRFSELRRVLRLNALPSFFDLRIYNTVLNRRCVGPLRAEDGSGGHYFELIAPQGLTVVGLWIGCRTKRKFNLLDVPIGSGCYGLNRRPEIIDHIVVGNNVRNVPRLIEDLNVPPG